MSDYSWIGPLVQMGASMMGEQKAGGLDAKQAALLQQIYDELRDVPLPELEKVVAEQLGPTKMGEVRSDPEQRMQQMDVLGELRDIIDSGGFDIQSEAGLNEALNRANVTGQAQSRALASEFANRGQLGSGARLALGNMNAQGAANRANTAALNIGAEGARRRMDAMGRYADLAGDVRRADFGEASARAQAEDAAARWNASAREKAGMYNAGLAQQQFNNQVTRATGSQAAGNNLAGFYGNQAQGTRNAAANYGSAAGLAAQGLANNLSDDEEDDAPHSASHY